MKIIGTTEDGRQIRERKIGGEAIHITETVEDRNARLEEAAYEAVRAAGPELLQACTGLLAAVNFLMEASESMRHEYNDMNDAVSESAPAIDYAITIVRKLNPDYGKPIETPCPPDLTA